MSAQYPLLNRNGKLSMDNKLLLYKTVIRPGMLYASHVWRYAAPGHINRLQVHQNKILRTIVNAPWYVSNRRIHTDLKIPLVVEHIRSTATKLAANMADNSNQVIVSLWNYDPEEQLGRFPRPKIVLNH